MSPPKPPLAPVPRAYCLRLGIGFTTAYHTQFPQYPRARAQIPEAWSYRLLLRFHAPAEHTLLPTESVRTELRPRGFDNLVTWSRRVDAELFRPRDKGVA